MTSSNSGGHYLAARPRQAKVTGMSQTIVQEICFSVAIALVLLMVGKLIWWMVFLS
jgi:hypothetical protein